MYKERVCKKERYKKCVCREIESVCVWRESEIESVYRGRDRDGACVSV